MTDTISREDYEELMEILQDYDDNQTDLALSAENISDFCEDLNIASQDILEKLEAVCSLLSAQNYVLDKLLKKAEKSYEYRSYKDVPF